MGQILVETTRCTSRWTIASDVAAPGKLMMTAVRIDAATRARLFRIIVVMGWITHAANAAGGLVPCRPGANAAPGSALRARSWVYASPPGLVLSCVTSVDHGPRGLLPRTGARRNTPWEGG